MKLVVSSPFRIWPGESGRSAQEGDRNGCSGSTKLPAAANSRSAKIVGTAWWSASAASCSFRLVRPDAAHHEATARNSTSFAIDCIEVTFSAGIQDTHSTPRICAAAGTSPDLGLGNRLSAGLTNRAMTFAAGITSWSNCIRFGANLHVLSGHARDLPPGRLKAATRPIFTGSAPVSKTIGMVIFAAFAASAAGVLAAAITATSLRTRSATIAGNCSYSTLRSPVLDRHVSDPRRSRFRCRPFKDCGHLPPGTLGLC